MKRRIYLEDIALEEAQYEDPDFQVGDMLEEEVPFVDFGRLAVQAAAAALPEWRDSSILRRARVMQKFLALLQANQKDIEGLSDEALAIILGHGWPGNVRELENEIERIVALHGDEVVPVRAKYDREEIFPRDILQTLASVGLTGVFIPEQYGGFGDAHSAVTGARMWPPNETVMGRLA